MKKLMTLGLLVLTTSAFAESGVFNLNCHFVSKIEEQFYTEVKVSCGQDGDYNLEGSNNGSDIGRYLSAFVSSATPSDSIIIEGETGEYSGYGGIETRTYINKAVRENTDATLESRPYVRHGKTYMSRNSGVELFRTR